jgi:hypothetical protein
MGVQEPLELLAGQGPDRQAGALIDRRAQLLGVLLVLVVVAVEVLVMVVGVVVLAHVLLLKLVAVRWLSVGCAGPGGSGEADVLLPAVGTA